jgi:predicted Zn-dependent peptidase
LFWHFYGPGAPDSFPQTQANQISLDELCGLGFDHYRRYPEQIEKVSKEDVQRVARKYINLEDYAIAIIRPPVGKKE